MTDAAPPAAVSLLWSMPDDARAIAALHATLFPTPWEEDAVKALLKDAKKELADYNEAPGAERFMQLVDFSYMSVHNGNQDCRDNKGLRALYDWSQELAHESLRRFILAGKEAEVMAV